MPIDKKTFLKTVTILHDTREQKNAHIIESLDKLGVKHEEHKLDYGDYSFTAHSRFYFLGGHAVAVGGKALSEHGALCFDKSPLPAGSLCEALDSGLAVLAGKFTVCVGVRLLRPVVLYYVNIVGAVLVLVVVLAVLVEGVEVSDHGIYSISPRLQPLGGLIFVCDCIISRIFDIVNMFIRYFIIFIRFHLI